MISVPRLERLTIQIDSPVKMDLVRISSCNRDFTTEKVGNTGGWFSETKTTFKYDYMPTAVESEGFCPLYIQIFDQDLLTAWGMVSFQTTEKLRAKVSCNGETYASAGLDSCYSMFGFEQGLSFEQDVKYAYRGPCEISKKSSKELRVRTNSLGFCTVTAYDGKDFFRFVLLGYDEILVRGKANPIRTDFGGGL